MGLLSQIFSLSNHVYYTNTNFSGRLFPMNTTENPIVAFRKEYNLTQQQLANYSDVTRQVITNLEAGLYNSIPPSVKNVIGSMGGINEFTTIEQRYQRWIISSLPSVTLMEAHIPVGSFQTWRFWIHESVAGFCKILKIQPVIITNYENGKTQELPQIVIERLEQIGVSDEYIETLKGLPAHGK